MTPEEFDRQTKLGNVCIRGIHAIGYPNAAICPFCGKTVDWIVTELAKLNAPK